MLVLFETPAGFALFKCLDDGKLMNVEDIGKHFQSDNDANKMYHLLFSFPIESPMRSFCIGLG